MKNPPNKESPNPLPEKLQKVAPYISQLPDEIKDVVISLMSASITATYSSPLPPSSEIEGYNKNIPNGGNRLMTIVEKQADSRLENDRKIVETKMGVEKLGMVFAFIIGIVGIGTGAALVLKGHDVAGGGLFTGTLCSLVFTFVTGKSARSNNNDRK